MVDRKPDIFKDLIEHVLKASDPFDVLHDALPNNKAEKVYVVGAGKAAAKMAAAFESFWDGEIEGLVITRYGHGFQTQKIKVVEAAHPVPDKAGNLAAKEIYNLAEGLTEKDHLVVLISGGGSALMSLPIEGVSLEDKQRINQALLASGANIHEMNCVRKHLSKIKGGGLAKAAFPARISSFAISDVAGDDPSVIASGPTIGDPTTISDAKGIIKKYQISYEGPFEETANADDPCFNKSNYKLIATPLQALENAAHSVRNYGYECEILSDVLEGDVEEIAQFHFQEIQKRANTKKPYILLSGGEATVKLTDYKGCGGPNAEFILHLLKLTKGMRGISAMAMDTDGIDGSEDNAGAWFDQNTYAKLENLGASIDEALLKHRSYDFFKSIDQLIMTGPTLTNINDFRALLIEP